MQLLSLSAHAMHGADLSPSQRRLISKTLQVMKLTTILLLATVLQVSARSSAQTITYTAKSQPLTTVFAEIKKQTGFVFFFLDEDLKNSKPVTVQLDSADVKVAMQMILNGQPLDYEIQGNTILISKKIPEKKPVVSDVLTEQPPVTGIVRGPDGQPLAGVNVVVKGTKRGVTTYADGKFSIDAGVNETLVISSVGFNVQELTIRDRNLPLIVVLQKSVSQLDEVQIIAYGSTAKRFITGNISSVKAEDIAKTPVQNPLLALQGRVPGIFIEQASGLPGGGVKVRIQGLNSINNGNDPLYIIDGVPYPSQLLPSLNDVLGFSGGGTVGSPMNFINPSDIESIDVLKDADATSIYGSRAASGAILITTKKGKAGKTKVDINLQNGWGEVTRKMDLMNTPQYLEMRRQALANEGIDLNVPPYNEDFYKLYLFPDLVSWDQNKYTDWQKELIGGTAQYRDATLSISGGSSNVNYLISANYKKATTVFPGDLNDQKGSLHFNINNTSLDNKLKVSLSGSFLQDMNNISTNDLTSTAITLAPNSPSLHNPDGSLNWEPVQQSDGSFLSSWSNPITYTNNKYNIKTNNLTSNALLSYELLPGLAIKSSFGYTYMQTEELTTFPISGLQPEYRSEPWALGRSSFANNNINSWTIEPQITYEKGIGKGKLDALIGTTFYERNSSRLAFNASGYTSDLVLEDLKAAPIVEVDPNSGYIKSTYKYTALFGRLSYNWNSKYIINTSFRRDGSSRYGIANRFHDFGSLAGAWIFSEEKFIKDINLLSFGKIRASYGTTGNDQVGDYSYLSLYENVAGSLPYQGSNGLRPGDLPNPYLQWEETKKWQAGIDLGFFQDRLLINATFTDNISSNQLMGYGLPSITGRTSITLNFPATVRNYGWEFVMSSINVRRRNFTWNSNFNISIYRNKLIEFPNLESSSMSNLAIGQPINLIRLYKYAGVDPSTGLYQFVTADGSTTTAPGFGAENKILFNDPNPRFYGGLQNSLTYKQFQLDFLFQFVKQTGLNYFFGRNAGQVATNQPLTQLDAWQKAGDVSAVQRYSIYFPSGPEGQTFANQSDKSYSDASYIRLKNISFSWHLPSNWMKRIKIQHTRLYTQAQNLITFTNYPGLDPEVRNSSSLPPLRIITAGI
ncbi:MAG: SusC/RagA family TonB-linked outer membrane protein, partial [Chitinophagaceae bacterium]|nr:SusC/RagA family TonB-linked outer membrane protein [Chitinophagaceae bacterium]